MYLPKQIEPLSAEHMQRLRGLSFPELCAQLLDVYIGEEIALADIRAVVEKSLQVFPSPAVVAPLTSVDGVFVSEMFQGPTLAFKDIALSVQVGFLEYFLKAKQEKISVLVGTSGDTGSAAAFAIRGSSQIEYFMLYPMGRISKAQEMQLNRFTEKHIHVRRPCASRTSR
jgi:threonine synthase